MRAILEDAGEVMKGEPLGELPDTAMIGAAQRIEHYEIAGYGWARTYASFLGDNDGAELQQLTRDEKIMTGSDFDRVGKANQPAGV